MEKPSQGSQDFTPDQPPSQSSSSLNGLQRTASELRQRFVDAAAGIGRQASHASQQASRALQGLGEQMASISRGDNGAKGGKGAKVWEGRRAREPRQGAGATENSFLCTGVAPWRKVAEREHALFLAVALTLVLCRFGHCLQADQWQPC